MSRFVEVAVPLPLNGPLTYAVPAQFERMAQHGVRVRVPVGRRTLIGMVTGALDEAPTGFKVKPIQSVLDHEPVLPEDLLQLAQEISKYYLAPIGEVLQAMLPSALPPWGDRQIWLTNAGALALARSAEEQEILAILRERGRLRISELVELMDGVDLYPRIEELESEGRVVISAGDRKGGRYQAAVELAHGELQELEERCGRSKPGRQIVRLLAALDRPASVREVTSTVGCTPAVIRRLISLGIVRQFTQVSRLELGHHWFPPRESDPIVLRQDQSGAVEALERALESGSYAAFLLAGITGSGKTEVYLRAVAQVLESGGSAVILVPEIALVPAVAGTTRERFGSLTAIFHSAMSPRERQQEWERIRQGEARVIVGPRSAVFTPARNLKLVIVDEEQDSSYKQDQVPRYHGRDLALLRAHRGSAVAVLVSATPSLETRLNVEKGKIQRLELTERVGQGALPDGVLVDLRQESAPRRPGEIHFSGRLTEEIERVLAQGDQIILLRNRRGYAPLLLCRACGDDSRCDECGLPRTLHLREGRLRCHYCGSMTSVPQTCPVCAEEALEAIGSGTERVEERVLEMWPEISVDVLDRDTARRGEAAAVLERFSKGESQVLVGTQMVSKGHHFTGVVLTAVLLADTYLSFPDFRAVEKTYNLLTQVAGRAGRGERPGRVIIQTYHPDHYAIQAALHHDDAEFAREEMRFRRIFHYPPYTRMVQLLVRDTSRQRALQSLQEISRRLLEDRRSREIRISGPAPAPFERLRGKWRYQMLLRHSSGRRVRDLVEDVLRDTSFRDLVIDVDPHELL